MVGEWKRVLPVLWLFEGLEIFTIVESSLIAIHFEITRIDSFAEFLNPYKSWSSIF